MDVMRNVINLKVAKGRASSRTTTPLTVAAPSSILLAIVSNEANAAPTAIVGTAQLASGAMVARAATVPGAVNPVTAPTGADTVLLAAGPTTRLNKVVPHDHRSGRHLGGGSTTTTASEIPRSAMTLDLQRQTWCSSGWAGPSAPQSLRVDRVAEYRAS